jgi:hypothetical protein
VVAIVETVETRVVVDADPHEVSPAVRRTRAQRLARFRTFIR